ncbi:non-hydrolyzing UDP-N-acetylglucosamine 2-epimerase [Salegentibacter sp. F14]
MEVDLIAGTRPNFVKIAGLYHAILTLKSPIKLRIIHTGQHYDHKLSGSFFEVLEIPEPDFNLNVGSGTQAEQTSGIMLAYERILADKKPDLCIVVGDVTSSMACAITAKKQNVQVVHIEAGLRSYDWKMPEEINRILIDSISDYHFTTSATASQILIEEGKDPNKVFFVGNIMIDTLLHHKSKFKKPEIFERLNLLKEKYLVLTIHRPSNVDNINQLKTILETLSADANEMPIIFPAHPRTAKRIADQKLQIPNIHITGPLDYHEFNYLIKESKAVITDSGGITEEASVLGLPCLSLRDNTERPETISEGTNELIGTNPEKFKKYLDQLFEGHWKKGNIPEKWDGKTGERIVRILEKISIF